MVVETVGAMDSYRLDLAGYFLDLAWSSMKRAPVITFLMVLAIGLGIGASMTMITVLHVMSGDPLPERSSRLFVPHINPLSTTFKNIPGVAPPNDNFTWPDAEALLRAHRAVRQAAMAGGRLMVSPQRDGLQPFFAHGRYTTSDFFGMFGVSFIRGSGWSIHEDEARAQVVVISEAFARKLFGQDDPIGKIVVFADADRALRGFRVVGVIHSWTPSPLFYASNSARIFNSSDEFFLPLSAAVDFGLPVDGVQFGVGPGNQSVPWHQRATSYWLQFWVQLDTPEQVRAYRQFLIDYSAEQRSLGRFQRPATDARLYGLMAWLRHENLIPSDLRLQMWLAIGFLFVCILSVISLLLAKFLRRSGEISIRRAMGACRRDIFVQLGVESAVIGVASGLLGLAIAQLGLWMVRQRPDDYAHLAQMDLPMLFITVAAAVIASIFAGLLPAWRACLISPGLQLKAQ